MEFKAGDLVIFCVEPGIHFTEDGFTTVITRGKTLCLPEVIDLFSYPSCSDFKGKMNQVNEGDPILILEFLGRPHQIGRDPDWFQYDVYLVYVNGMISQAFKQNLRRINDRFNSAI